MKQRTGRILQWLSGLWRSFQKWTSPAFYVGVSMVMVSVILIALSIGIFQASGTAMLAAGLTIITTTLTNKESVSQQFAKEANIVRKDAIYGPLFVELKRIYEWLDEAKRKEGRYPFYIYGAGGEPDHTMYQRNPLYPTFLQWPQFKQDYRIDNFKLKTRELLDEAQYVMMNYNRVMATTMEPVVNVLAPHIEKALAAWMASASFLAWDQRSSGGQNWDHDPLHEWNSNLKRQPATTTLADISLSQSKLWLGPNGGLGWLVSGSIDKASTSIVDSYRTQSSMAKCPDEIWFKEIIDEAWLEIDNFQEVKEARIVAEILRKKVGEVKDLLEFGIRFIRDQYEGGEPPV